MVEGIEKIRNELRGKRDLHILVPEFLEELDAIEREVEEQIEECYVELPKDANGERIHIGDELDCGKVSRIEITSDGDHKVYFRTKPDNPHLEWRLCRYVHHKPTTVEGMLEKFASERIDLFFRRPMGLSDEEIKEFQEENGKACDELIAEYAAKLQIRKAE